MFHGGTGKTYRNTTGQVVGHDPFIYPNGKAGTYHWDEAVGAAHGGRPHLQIHTHDGEIIRIFFAKPQ